jgi:hypothetical protein
MNICGNISNVNVNVLFEDYKKNIQFYNPNNKEERVIYYDNKSETAYRKYKNNNNVIRYYYIPQWKSSCSYKTYEKITNDLLVKNDSFLNQVFTFNLNNKIFTLPRFLLMSIPESTLAITFSNDENIKQANYVYDNQNNIFLDLDCEIFEIISNALIHRDRCIRNNNLYNIYIPNIKNDKEEIFLEIIKILNIHHLFPVGANFI